ncbi:MAG: ATP-binding protein [Spirochaetales bacterium]|nr:ATP-binding protein [Spirochaetales bacterium]
MRKKCLPFILLLFPVFGMGALDKSEFVQVLTVDDGLAQNSILHTEVDSSGFLWLGTQAGVSRWNGKQVVNYPRKGIDPFPPGYINLIQKDSRGRLWIVPSDGRLYLRHEGSDQFIDTGLDTEGLGSSIIRIISDDTRNYLILCTEEGNLYSWIYGDRIVNWISRLSGGRVNTAFWLEGDLYLGTDRGWEILKDGITPLPEDKFPLWMGNPVLPVKEALFHQSTLYTAGGESGFRISSPLHHETLYFPEVRTDTVVLDFFDTLLTGGGSEFWRLQGQGADSRFIREPSSAALQIRNMKYMDTGQVIVGSRSTGLWMLDPYQPRVDSWVPGEAAPEQNSVVLSNDIMAFSEDSRGIRWLATYDGGIIRWDSLSNLVRVYSVETGRIPSNRIKFLMTDSRDNVWAGTYDSGLLKYNPESDTFPFPQDNAAGDPHDLRSGTVNHILELPSGHLLFSSEKGLFDYDPGQQKLSHMGQTFNSEALSEGCWAALDAADGTLWIGTDEGLFYVEDGTVHSFNSSLKRVWFLTQVQSGEIFAASPSGLEIVDRNRNPVDPEELKQPLAEKNIYGVLQDQDGQYWISTNAGVVRWDRANRTSRLFTVKEGLLSQEFNLYSLSLLDDGRVVLGCIEGLNIIDTSLLIDDLTPSKVFIDQIDVARHSLEQEQSVSASNLPADPLFYENSILLTPDDSILNISFQSIDFNRAARTELKYRLLGFSDQWVDVSREQRVNFVNLPHGDYRFDLLAVKNGVIESELQSLDIEIQPSFVETPFFTSLIAFILMSIVLLVVTYILRLNTEIRQRQAAEADFAALNASLEEQVSERTGELNNALEHLKQTQEQIIHQEKMSSLGLLVAGVAHEINTPLGVSVLSNSIIKEKVRFLEKQYKNRDLTEEDLSESLDDLGNASDRLSYNLDRAVGLVNNFKQVAVQQNQEEIHSFDLIRSIHSLLNSLYNETKRKHISLQIKAPETLMVQSYPGDIVQVLTNLVMNCIHHAFRDSTPHDKPEISIEVEAEADSVYILFQDNGCGMTEETAARIFDPFFTTNREDGGTGLGLHIVFNIVTEKLKGHIAVNSTPGEGTVFAVNFPRILEYGEDTKNQIPQ